MVVCYFECVARSGGGVEGDVNRIEANGAIFGASVGIC